MTYRAVLELPIAVFWFLHDQIDRLRAEDDIRHLTVAASAQSGESIKQTMERLTKQLGDIVIIDKTKAVMSERLDREGLASLKALGR